MMRLWLALVCSLTAALASHPAHAAADGSVVLTRTYKPGSVFFRSVEMETRMVGDDEGTSTQKESEKILVKAVARDGTMKFAKIVDEDMGGLFSGVSLTGRSMIMSVDRLGRLLSLQVYNDETGETLLPASPDLAVIEQMREVLLPGRPVRVGETWETKVENFKVGGEKILVRTTLLGAEKDGAKRLWHVKQTAAVLEGRKPNAEVGACRAQFWLDAETHMTVRSEVRYENASGSMTVRTHAVKGAEQ